MRWFLYMMWDGSLIFFCKWISSFPMTVYWWNLPSPIVWSWHFHQQSIDHRCMDFFSGFSILSCRSECLLLCQHHADLINTAFSRFSNQVLWGLQLWPFYSTLFQLFWSVCDFIWILGFFFFFCQFLGNMSLEFLMGFA